MVKETERAREREMFYLTTHSTDFIYGYMASDMVKERERCLFNDALNTFHLRLYHMVKERERCLFNDALNTFHLRLYGIRHMVKDHSDSARKPAAATWATLYD